MNSLGNSDLEMATRLGAPLLLGDCARTKVMHMLTEIGQHWIKGNYWLSEVGLSSLMIKLTWPYI